MSRKVIRSGMGIHRVLQKGVLYYYNSWSVCILTQQFEHKTFSQPPDPSVLANYLSRNFPGTTYRAVYETGYSGFWIHDQLREKGIDCIVVNPADIPTTDKEQAGKTDKVDCCKLARRLWSWSGTRIKLTDHFCFATMLHNFMNMRSFHEKT